MQQKHPSSWDHLLEAVYGSERPVSLNDLVAGGQVKLDRSTIHRHLNAMVEQGFLRREGERKDARYLPQERLTVRWNAPLGRHWRQLSWSTTWPVDWRYPLVSRVPDMHAQKVLVRFLDALAEKRLLSPRQFYREWLHQVKLEGWGEEDKRELRLFLGSPRFDLGLTVVLYGSCARGNARQESDVDVLVIAPTIPPGLAGFRSSSGRVTRKIPSIGYDAMIADVAAEVNLGASRPLDVICTEEEALDGLHPSLLQDIKRDGITVHGTAGRSWFVEAWPDGEG